MTFMQRVGGTCVSCPFSLSRFALAAGVVVYVVAEAEILGSM